MDAKLRNDLNSVGLLILRVGIGGFMLTHGAGKLRMILDGKASEFAADPFGIGNATSLYLVTFAEFLCSILIILGLGTRLAAIPLVITMAVAAFWAHKADPWTLEKAFKNFTAGLSKYPVAKEGALLFLIPFAALIFTGPGRFSIDAIICRRPRPAPTK
jgi:putative oxidoreductase